MRRSGLTKLLLFGLVVVTVLLFVRVFSDSSDGLALVVFEGDFEVDDLKHGMFAVHDRPVQVRVSATGSLQSDSVIAAYPWILRHDDRTVVWKLERPRAVREKGMTLTQSDIITLDPGNYDAYFTSYGDPALPAAPAESFFDRISAFIDSDFQRWRTESGQWHFSIEPLAAEDGPLIVNASMNETPESQGLVWSTGPMANNSISEYLFETAQTLEITVRCVGEIFREHEDIGWIEDIESGEHIWDMTTDVTTPAGGSIRNRECRQKVNLPEGRFRAVFRTDDVHGYHDWRANPPHDPEFWGMEIAVDRPEAALAVTPFDPRESLPRIVSLTGIGDDQLVSHSFTLDQPMRVMVHALGEGYTSRGAMFDYAWLVGGADREVWKMSIHETKHAGGSKKNRRAETVLSLEAGIPYTVYYKTDGSHAFGDWNEDPPLHPDQWGVTIFSLDPDYIPSIDASISSPVPPVSKPGYKSAAETPLVSIQSVGNNMNMTQQFVLNDGASVHIYALGEMTRDGRYDWGWIVNLETGSVVWEMRRENSQSAGGTSKNRFVDTVVELPQGKYEVHYVTDDTHAFPDFRYGGAPDNPTAWGITVQLLQKGNGNGDH